MSLASTAGANPTVNLNAKAKASLHRHCKEIRRLVDHPPLSDAKTNALSASAAIKALTARPQVPLATAQAAMKLIEPAVRSLAEANTSSDAAGAADLKDAINEFGDMANVIRQVIDGTSK